MGILTRKQEERFVVSSDHANPQANNKRAARIDEHYQVWTGAAWSANTAEALLFDSLDMADDYVRANYSKLASSV
jgi:hypothetical protein